MLIYYWEDLRLQVFSHELAILHYVGGGGSEELMSSFLLNQLLQSSRGFK
jgi:hypothetical protein